ncbi:MAG: hypothetical protein U0176_18210 [Bacteroidia bacterium]
MKSNNSTIPLACDHTLEAFEPDRPQLLALRRRCPTCRKMVQARRDDTVILPEPELPQKSKIEWELEAERLRVRMPTGMATVPTVFRIAMGIILLICPFLPFVEKEISMPEALQYIVSIGTACFIIGHGMYVGHLERTIEFDRNKLVLHRKSLGLHFRKEGETADIKLILYFVYENGEDTEESLHIRFGERNEIKISVSVSTAEMKWLEQMLLQTQARLLRHAESVAQ